MRATAMLWRKHPLMTPARASWISSTPLSSTTWLEMLTATTMRAFRMMKALACSSFLIMPKGRTSRTACQSGLSVYIRTCPSISRETFECSWQQPSFCFCLGPQLWHPPSVSMGFVLPPPSGIWQLWTRKSRFLPGSHRPYDFLPRQLETKVFDFSLLISFFLDYDA